MFISLEDDAASMLIKDFYVEPCSFSEFNDEGVQLVLDVCVGMAAPVALGSRIRGSNRR